jgi:NADH dehydrogenase (ubiquinone) 1 alpha/beta subcomplex 1, acyl-carrier protein
LTRPKSASRIVVYILSADLTSILQLTSTSAFAEDLGLDSLDAVEVVMAVEEVRNYRAKFRTIAHQFLLQEFNIEIPDAEADEIKTVEQGAFSHLPLHLPLRAASHNFISAIDYIAKTPEGKSNSTLFFLLPPLMLRLSALVGWDRAWFCLIRSSAVRNYNFTLLINHQNLGLLPNVKCLIRNCGAEGGSVTSP